MHYHLQQPGTVVVVACLGYVDFRSQMGIQTDAVYHPESLPFLAFFTKGKQNLR
jgi:hypothetical protein